MRQRRPNLLLLRARRVLLALACASLGLLAPAASGFKVGGAGYPAIHEGITQSAMMQIMPAIDFGLVMNVQSGVLNTDLAHFFGTGFHFDDSSTVTNTGFSDGFGTLYGMLSLAKSDATMIDGAGNRFVNPLFLTPIHTSYRDLLWAVVQTYDALVFNPGCLEDSVCPTTQIGDAEASALGSVLPVLLDTDPDPDANGGVYIADLGLSIPDFSFLVTGAKQDLDAILGSHCDIWGTCYATLEDEANANGDRNFIALAGQLRVLQYEYQAYFAWQHLGHAFHTTQDLFAHSNYVELGACLKGPPCAPNANQAGAICDNPINSQVVGYDAIPLPTDGGIFNTPLGFANAFNTLTVQ